ncbi:NAD-dependent epimerase/dehydratase family protein [Paenibacillus sp. PDC88]|uniref:NAD-dependent epimerase/dehydratase family protein n=1 Tax=Paenibacillus sp. PDC88 TaxID=1884375 RepID=UPI00089A82CA|nr:NAD-dependent epimerase/dehydratase family protein [Paenibacillus sp. PDC88]SDW72875.1 UDP-sulfoquinovose synthase [Paenibacillus sp. PDC88]
MTNMDVHKKIIVFGGDGFCGWPTSLHLSSLGHEVIIIDNLSRRRIDEECQTNSLTPIQSMENRLEAWKEVSGKHIQHYLLNVAEDYDDLLNVIVEEKPDVMIHFAEQRSAPYSMKSSRLKRYTVNNNINATHNILSAIVESGLDIHLIHLGTMGVYGYGTAGIPIPEGYLDIEVVTEAGDRVQQQILYPTHPGSIYHMTKSQDQLLFAFYNKNDKLRITDLHQGIVWGTHTRETQLDERLINRFDYDGDYGTVLNRFLMQAAIGHPITVHGTGGQTRAFIHIQDTVRCIQLAVEHPPATGDRVLIMNQMTETHRVIDLAEIVSRLTGTEIAYVPNPRQEAAENDLHVENGLFLSKGLVPITLNEGLLSEITEIAKKYANRADHSKIPAMSTWTKQQKPGLL